MALKIYIYTIIDIFPVEALNRNFLSGASDVVFLEWIVRSEVIGYSGGALAE
jgi:hypothetical protein